MKRFNDHIRPPKMYGHVEVVATWKSKDDIFTCDRCGRETDTLIPYRIGSCVRHEGTVMQICVRCDMEVRR